MSIPVDGLLKVELDVHLRVSWPQHTEVCSDASVVTIFWFQPMTVENLWCLSQLRGMDAMAAGHARTDKGEQAADVF